MSTTPIKINLRANEWQEIVLLLNFAAQEADEVGFATTSRQANKFAAIISKRVEESS